MTWVGMVLFISVYVVLGLITCGIVFYPEERTPRKVLLCILLWPLCISLVIFGSLLSAGLFGLYFFLWHLPVSAMKGEWIK